MITRKQYKDARRLIRDNGYYALIWLKPSEEIVFSALRYQVDDVYSDIQTFFNSCSDIKKRLMYRKAVYLALMD